MSSTPISLNKRLRNLTTQLGVIDGSVIRPFSLTLPKELQKVVEVELATEALGLETEDLVASIRDYEKKLIPSNSTNREWNKWKLKRHSLLKALWKKDLFEVIRFSNDKDKSKGEVDVHLQSAPLARKIVQLVLILTVRLKTIKKLDIITGYGKSSGSDKIKREITDFISTNRFNTEDEDNKGILNILIDDAVFTYVNDAKYTQN